MKIVDTGSAKYLRSLWLILVVALALRAGYAVNYRISHSAQALRAIPFLFEPGNIAASLVDGDGYASPLRVESGPTAWMTPVYPLLLAGVFRVFGKYSYRAWEAAVTLNIAFGVLTCLPVFGIGQRVRGLTAAAIGAWVWAVFPNALIIPVESMWDAPLAAFLGACIVFYTLRIAGSRTWPHWALYGALWGLALMTSATLGLALPFLLAWLVWRSRTLTGPAIATAVIFLACLPWTVRNYREFHAFVPLRSVGGLSLWLGTIDPDLGKWPASFHPLADSRERERFLELGEIGYMRDRAAAARQFIASHPGDEARLGAHRFVALWAGGAMHPWDAFAHSRSNWIRLVIGFNVFLAITAAIGLLLLCKRRNAYLFAVAAMPVVIPFAFYLTLASARYRLLVDPEVAVLAAAALGGSAGVGTGMLDRANRAQSERESAA